MREELSSSQHQGRTIILPVRQEDEEKIVACLISDLAVFAKGIANGFRLLRHHEIQHFLWFHTLIRVQIRVC